jgi:hypothetical protein
MYKDRLSLSDIISLFSIIGLLISIVMMVGIAGGVDCDSITILDAAKKSVVWCIVLTLSVMGLLKVQKDEESEYEDL